MKLFKYGLPLAALAMLASCSNDNVDAPGVNPGQQNAKGANLSLNICLSQTDGSRTGETYKEGTEAEQDVKSGKVYIFKGASEDVAKFYEEADLEFSDWVNPKDQYLEAVGLAKGKAKLEKAYDKSGSTKYWVMVVLNAAGSYPSLTEDSDGRTELLQLTSNDYKTTDGFVMTSAPSYLGDTNVSWMSQLSDSWVANQTDEESATNVYVQRIAAKVQVLGNPTDNASNYTITVNGWNLDNINTESFLLQNVGTGWKDYANGSRFYAYNPANNPEHNRIFWGMDVNYDKKDGLQLNYSTSDAGAAVVPTDVTYKNLSADAYDYCHENTFEVEHMTKDCTTRVIISAKAVPTVEGYTAADDGSFFKNVDNKIWTIASLKTAIAAILSTESNTYGADAITFKLTLDKGYSNLALKAGLGVNLNGTEISDDLYALVASQLKILGSNLDFYYKGECFYDLRVRHFLNGETGLPNTWFIDGETYAKSHVENSKVDGVATVAGAEAGANANNYFLGRYGVVRNNWYELTINSIADIGSATPPTPDTTTDDDPEEAKLMFTVNILSWAKRQHEYNL